MRIRYIVPIKRPIIIDDHWEIPFMGGKCRVIEENGYAQSLEITFEKQPIEYAPLVKKSDGILNITARDHRLLFVKHQLDSAATFLECVHDIQLKTNEIESKYEGETQEEEDKIAIKILSKGEHKPALSLSFDMLTRAIMAAESQDGPKFEATLFSMARKAISNREFINSFRYSFLLVESLYGNGQFKTSGLQSELKSSKEFCSFVEIALSEYVLNKNPSISDTEKLIAEKASVHKIIEHLVEKRGFYFHGNIKRKNAWKPNEQSVAEAVAFLAIGIVHQIAMKAASPIFNPDLNKRHFEDAMRAGAKLVLKIKYKYRMPEEKFDRDGQVDINMPGTKVTPKAAFECTQQFLEFFQEQNPVAALLEAECLVDGHSGKIFSLQLFDDTKNVG